MDLPENRPLLVGITGGIGSGKSVVAKAFETLGAKVYNADQRAKDLMTEDPELVKGLQELFGKEVIDANGLNRQLIASKIFKDESLRLKLNALVHPAVGRDFRNWVIENTDQPYLIKEAALMVTSGSYKQLDVVIGVSASEQTRIKRVLERDPQRSEEQIKGIIESQIGELDGSSHWDVTLINDNNAPVLEHILKMDKHFRSLKETA